MPEPARSYEFNVRAHYMQRLVASAAVCHELKHADGEIVGRPQAALAVLSEWMHTNYALPEGDVKFTYGFDDPLLTAHARDLKPELFAAAGVCDALAMAFTADTDRELKGDIAHLKNFLDSYLRRFDW